LTLKMLDNPKLLLAFVVTNDVACPKHLRTPD